jgi:hypothetical protein
VQGFQVWADALQGPLKAMLASPAPASRAATRSAGFAAAAPADANDGAAALAASTPPAQWPAAGGLAPIGGPAASASVRRKVDLLGVGTADGPGGR